MGIKDMILKKVVKEQVKNYSPRYSPAINEEYAEDVGIGKYYEHREKERERAYIEQKKFDKSVEKAINNKQVNHVNYDYEQRHKKELERIELQHKEEVRKLMDHIKLLEKQVNKLTIANDIIAGKAKQREREEGNALNQVNSAIEQLAAEIFDK